MGTNIISWPDYIESYPIRKKLDGWDEQYSSVHEFKQHLSPELLSSEFCIVQGWVFWSREREYSSGHVEIGKGRIPEKITHVLEKLLSRNWYGRTRNILVQFWAPEEVGGRCCLTTLHQPFAVIKSLAKGVCWLRKKCMQHNYYIADDAADKDQLGPPGRVFQYGNPESSPDILLYSTKEFPLQDLVVGCGLKSYLALPIFDVHQHQCVGILEFICQGRLNNILDLCSPNYLDDALEEIGLRLAHKIRTLPQIVIQEPPEIAEMLDLAIGKVPQLHLALVWVPCKQCGNNNTNVNCMQLAAFKTTTEPFLSDTLSQFVNASELHNIQNGQGIVELALSSTKKSCFCENLSAFSISEYPMAHHAQRERLSFCFTICLSRKHNGNDPHVFQFFLQPQSRDGASIQSILHLIVKIMEKKLKSFEITTEHIIVIPMRKYKGRFSVSEFKEFFQEVDLSCLLERGKKDNDWICRNTKEKELSENRGDDTSIPQLNLGTDEIKHLLSEILSIETFQRSSLIQFWAPKIIGKRSFLSTSEQPFALHDLQKGLCLYRKQCIQYLYFIGDGADEEELGPPGRVFLNGRTEASPDLRLYSKREFPLRDHVVKSNARAYLALPLFNFLDKQCVGVLEIVDFLFWPDQIYGKLEKISFLLQKYNLRSTRISRPSSIDEGTEQALFEIKEMITQVVESPQLQAASAWMSCGQCDVNNIEISCMEREWFSTINSCYLDYGRTINEFIRACEFLQVDTRKGTIRKVIESKTKLYFCENLCSLSICELPLAHFAQVARLEICFAICLKSSYTGNRLHVIEFFLSPHSKKYEYSRTLCFLLSIMKQMLKSFKVASGQQLGEELVFEVRELGHGTEHHLSKNVVHFESGGIDSRKSVEDASQNITGFSTRNQHTVEFGDDACNIDQEQERILADVLNVEDNEAQNITDVNFEEGNERDRSSTSFHVSYDQLKSQFGKSRKDAAKNLGVSISTFKRKCRDYDIKRWPSNMNNIKNPSLFRTKVGNKCAGNADQQTSAPSGFDLKTSDFPIEPNLISHPIQKTTELASTCQEADVVIKAKFKGDILKFEFCISWGVEKLREEVGRRLKLKIGEFKLTYVDLNFYVKSMKSVGKTTVQVLVHLISE